MQKEYLVYDTEANGLLDEPNHRLWCLSYCTVGRTDKGTIRLVDMSTEEGREAILEVFSRYSTVICHNQLGFDLVALLRLYGIRLSSTHKLIDTLVLSKLVYPDRQLPKGCDTSTLNPVTGKKDKITPHGLASWGYRVGRHKPLINDWRTFDEKIINRCEEDVKINLLTYLALCTEADTEFEGVNISENCKS